MLCSSIDTAEELAGGSVDLDAPEIHSGNSQDARLAFEDAKELCCVWHPFLVTQAKEPPTDAMQPIAIEHELALHHVSERVTAPRTLAAVSTDEGSIFFRRGEGARSRILGVHIPVRAVADLNHRPRLFMGVAAAGPGSARRLRSRFCALGPRTAKNKGVIGQDAFDCGDEVVALGVLQRNSS